MSGIPWEMGNRNNGETAKNGTWGFFNASEDKTPRSGFFSRAQNY
jgi:hypothetical protein